MKKYLPALLLLLTLVVATACGDDEKLPDVELRASIADGVTADGVVYVVKGETLNIESISFDNHTGKDAAIGTVSYFLDGRIIGRSEVAPYGIDIPTGSLAPGSYLISAEMPLYVVDYPICWGMLTFTVKVVATADDIPSDATASTLCGVLRSK